MRNDDSLIIEKVGNGWLVRPYAGAGNEGLVALSDIYAFQELQYDGQDVQHSEKCLFGFLLKHFPEKTSA